METLPDAKVCTRCGADLPRTAFYVKHKKTGVLFSWCKTCHGQMTGARYRRLHPEKPKIDPETAAAIATAKKAAYRAANREQRIAYNAEYRANHANQRKAYQAASYAANKDEINAKMRQRRRDQPERMAEIARKSKEKHVDRVRAYTAKHRRANAELYKAAYNRRRFREKGNGGSSTPAEWEALKAKYDDRCLRCGKAEPEISLSIDHVIPLIAGGRNDIANAQPLCRHCTSLKSRRHTDYRPPE